MKRKNNIMKSLLVLTFVLGALSTTSIVAAQEGAQNAAQNAASAPNVVAPAQPVSAQTNATSASTGVTSEHATAQQPQPSLMGMAMPFLVMLAVMYFLMIRPQQKKAKEHQTMMSELKTGDEVVTSSGIIGTIAGMTEKVVTLEVSKNVQLKVLKNQVNQVVKGSI